MIGKGAVRSVNVIPYLGYANVLGIVGSAFRSFTCLQRCGSVIPYLGYAKRFRFVISLIHVPANLYWKVVGRIVVPHTYV